MIVSVLLVLTIASLACVTTATPLYPVPQKEDAAYWRSGAEDTLKKATHRQLNTNVAKNIILFIADGWDIPTVTAARILKGQIQGNAGEETVMEYEKFPHMGLIKIYNIDMMTPDSSSTATAILSGVKTRNLVLGADGETEAHNCPSQKGHEVDTILDWAQAAGKSVGIVTTAMAVSATPSAAYAHAAYRRWMTDTRMAHDGVDPRDGCRDIAYQFVVENPNIQVMLGGGRSAFTERDPTDTRANRKFMYRSDGIDLIEMWKDDKERRGIPAEYVTNSGELAAVDANKTDYLLGLFASLAMQFDLDRNKTADGEPSLTEMVEKAIQILSRNPNGYFLLVEGALVDDGHHHNMAKRALYDALAFEEAVKRAKQMTNKTDSLIVVTADHSHTMVINGYTYRGNDILGEIVYDELNERKRPTDGKPTTVLVYANGASYNVSGGRPDITNMSITDDNDYMYQMAIPMTGETHSGADVPVFADGPMSHLFFGVQEQNYIAYAMAYASCVGNHTEHCVLTTPTSGTGIQYSSGIGIVTCVLLLAMRLK